MERTLRRIILLLALIGLLLSLYLFKEHLLPSGKSFCDINQKISCDIVNRSPYAEILGVPVSLLGILYYLALLVLLLYPRRVACLIARGDAALLWRLLQAALGVGFLFSLYLTAIEAFVLGVWCPLCVASALIVTGSLLLSFLPRKA